MKVAKDVLINEIPIGVYRLYYTSGGSIVGLIGRDDDGSINRVFVGVYADAKVRTTSLHLLIDKVEYLELITLD